MKKTAKRPSLAEMEAYNKKGFLDAKKKFDKIHGELFAHVVHYRTGPYEREYSWAEKVERAILRLLDQYENRSLSAGTYFGEDADFSMARLAETFVVTDRFFGFGYDYSDEREMAGREAENYWEPAVMFYELDETAQASRVRSLFSKLVAKGASIAHEIGSDTYGEWRELLIFVGEYSPPMTHHLTKDETRRCYKGLSPFKRLHQRLRIDLNVFGLARASRPDLGQWAARWVSDFSAQAGFIELSRGKQRSYQIPSKSKKAWEILVKLFTSENPEGWTKLPTGWRSQFVRKIGSTGELDRNSDIVKIAKYIVPRTPRKGRAGDGLYRFGYARPPALDKRSAKKLR